MPPFDPMGNKTKEKGLQDIMDSYMGQQKLQTDMIIDVIHNTIRKEIRKKTRLITVNHG